MTEHRVRGDSEFYDGKALTSADGSGVDSAADVSGDLAGRARANAELEW